MTFVEWIKGWHLASVAIVAALGVFAFIKLTDNTETTAHIETAIRFDIADQADVDAMDIEVDCPETVEWEANEAFHCVVTGEGESVRVTVHMESKDGDYTWAVE